METFALHPRLQNDTSFVGDWALSRVLLMNDARFPWFILVPRRDSLHEIHDLMPEDSELLIKEITHASQSLKFIAGADKINIGALGNIVPQLHVHILARRSDDVAWPGPVWGCGAPVPYENSVQDVLIEGLRNNL
jgi:diadenosine tetraphosphate (Ap4A) HIT family hydrolase